MTDMLDRVLTPLQKDSKSAVNDVISEEVFDKKESKSTSTGSLHSANSKASKATANGILPNYQNHL